MEINSNTLTHLRKDESVSVNGIGKICVALNCAPNDIVEFTNNILGENV